MAHDRKSHSPSRNPGSPIQSIWVNLRHKYAGVGNSYSRDTTPLIQNCPSGRYEDLAFNEGWVGPSPSYRKLERLEGDPMFRAWIENSLFKRIATSLLGDGVLLYRTVLWNKAPHAGMATPWHQDDGRFWGLDRPPVLQVWTALDDASEAAGCLEVLPGSHMLGLASPEGGTITPAALEQARAEHLAVALPARRGECILVHNHTWHRTGFNRTHQPRRALSVSFLSAQTRCKRKRRAPRTFERLFVDDQGVAETVFSAVR